MGFILRRTDSESTASSQLLEDVQTESCTLTSSAEDQAQGNFIFRIFPENFSETVTFEHVFGDNLEEGLYDLEFERCYPRGEFATTFTISFEMKNSDTDYLSAGDAPLPTMYIVFSAVFFAAFAYWIMFLLRNRSNIHKIHYIMSAMVFVKAFSLVLESITWHYIKTQGTPLDWIYIDDAVKAVKGMMLFGVILLIGSGWSFMKPFFNEREKRIVYIVIPLQVVANIAMVWVDESAPGSQTWITWKDILALTDIICCCAVLFPIVWQIRHLRLAAQASGKVNMTLVKLKQFQHFYIMVVAYIYFTRIVVFLLRNSLPFKFEWLSVASSELATLTFYVLTGYYFRPVTNNPYLRVRTADYDGDDEENGIEMAEEFGLGEKGPKKVLRDLRENDV
jgi:G protein-coupled receptor 107